MKNRYEIIKTRLLVFVLIELIVLIFFNLFFNGYLTLVQYLFIIASAFIIFYMYLNMVETRKERVLSVTQVLGNQAKSAFDFGKVGMVTFGDEQEITWMSELFDEYETLEIGEFLFDVFPELKPLVNEDQELVRLKIEEDVYEATTMNNDNIVFFQNVTDLDVLEATNRNNQVVLGIAHLDNYEETTQYEEEQTIAFIDSNIRQAVVRWADQHQMYIRRIRPDRYLMVLNEKVFDDITRDRFSILHEIRKESTKIDASITLSLAFARKSDNFKELEDMSNKALELAQGRGGDQVAINTKHETIKYYGGSTEAFEKRSKVRVRVTAQSLGDHISHSSNVVIVGHKMTDFDCFGSALGVSSIASVYNKDVSIVVDLADTERNLANAITSHKSEIERDHNFISNSQAKDIIKSSSLLIMVDHHSLSQTQFPELVESAERIIVIDHHRRTDEFQFKPTLTYIESSASSASELVVELFPYHRRNVVISKIQATLMYTGMLIDTNRFRNRSGSRTFEAAAELRKFGADLDESENMLRDDYEEFEMKNKILSTCVVFDEHFVIAPFKDEELPRPLMSQAADEIISVRNVEASFVVAHVDADVVAVSARSNGDLNVQLVMERLGGGGHFTGAAAQIRGQSINEVVESIKEAIVAVREEL